MKPTRRSHVAAACLLLGLGLVVVRCGQGGGDGDGDPNRKKDTGLSEKLPADWDGKSDWKGSEWEIIDE